MAGAGDQDRHPRTPLTEHFLQQGTAQSRADNRDKERLNVPNTAFPPAWHCTEQSGQQRQGEIECSCFDPPSWST